MLWQVQKNPTQADIDQHTDYVGSGHASFQELGQKIGVEAASLPEPVQALAVAPKGEAVNQAIEAVKEDSALTETTI